MKRRFIQFSAMMLAVSVFFVACNNETDGKETGTQENTVKTEAVKQEEPVAKNIVETAIASPDHTTLVEAVKAAGLVETLSGTGPFTVFAPTNAAFAALPAGTLDNLLKPENKADLTSILTYHVVPGKVMSSQLTDGQKIKTVNGAELTVTIKDGKVMIDGANVTAADLDCSNGVIHVIDAVVLPKK